MGCGCPKCNNSKGEMSIMKILDDVKINYEYQKSFKDCRNKLPLSFDFYLIDYNICIEFDGRQHFQIIEKWGGIDELASTQKRDQIKNEYCHNNNIRLYRIKYDEDINLRMGDIIKNLI